MNSAKRNTSLLLHKLLLCVRLVVCPRSVLAVFVRMCVVTVTNNLFTLYSMLQLRAFSVLSRPHTNTLFLRCIKGCAGFVCVCMLQANTRRSALVQWGESEYRKRAVHDASTFHTVTTHAPTNAHLEPLRDVIEEVELG